MQYKTYLAMLILLLSISFTSSAQDHPWRLTKALAFPDWLTLSVEHRTRYETLDNQYRATVNGQPGNGGDQALVFRTLVHGKIDLDYFRIGAEMIDSRIELADQGSATNSSRLTTTIANPLELLQAYLEIPFDSVIGEHSISLLRAGRITMDVGSRRLVARNRFRNTINAFTGLDWQWKNADRQFRAFYTLPIHRLVDESIFDNKPSFDREDTEVRFWGLYYSQPFLSKRDNTEIFLFGLNEDDADNLATRNRELYTFGLRFWRTPSTGVFDYQLETVYQLGESRTSTSSNTTLDHWAHFHHGELGYSFASPWSPRLIAQIDYASGDKNPNDGENNRFDTLYGARRFDFGPTSIYGAFARSNLISPGLRIHLKPYPTIKTMLSARGFWRAETSDSWTSAGINGQDAYIGSQLEARVRWEPLPNNLRIEGGVAHLIAGDLMNEAEKGDTTYLYTQVSLMF
jgi:alginate export protein